MITFEEAIRRAAQQGASDVHISEGDPVMLRVDGALVACDLPIPGHEEMEAIMLEAANEGSLAEFRRRGESDFAAQASDGRRLRCNLYRSLGKPALSVRLFPKEIPTAESLSLPEKLVSLCDRSSGLILVTGATGSGKSTTLAALLNYINQRSCRHIVTLEDPVEYIHTNQKASFHHRQVGSDTESFASGIRSVLRQDPDVIMVGEMRDLETMATAISAAESGHLVLATLHTSNAASSIDRIIDAFPGDEQHQIRIQLADTLLAVVSQTLVPRIGGGRAAAFELLFNQTAVQSMIREGKTYQLPSVIQTGKAKGMFFRDDALIDLCRSKIISVETALLYSDDLDRVKAVLCPPAPIQTSKQTTRRDKRADS